MVYTYQDFEESARFLLQQTPLRPRVGIILGSGLGRITEELTEVTAIDYSDILHFPRVKDPYHQCRLYLGCLDGVPVAAMSGRYHYYEGYSMAETAFPVGVMKLMGIETLIVTNAAGGINPSFGQGGLMLICDHIKLCAESPTRGFAKEVLGERFFDISHVYREDLQALAKEAAARLGIPLWEGVYAFMSGPQYETPAEIRALRTLGADAVGMSTVPEVIMAGYAGLPVLGLSCITNMAAGISQAPITNDEVLEIGQRVSRTFIALVREIVSRLAGRDA